MNPEKMKTFYWYFRPIVLFYKIVGILPLDNLLSLDTTKIRFRFISWSFAYSCLMFFTIIGMMVKYSGYIFSFTTKNQQILSYVVYGMAARSIGSFMMYSFKSYYEMPRLIQLLETFDKRKREVVTKIPNEWKSLFKYTVFPLILSLLQLFAYLNITAMIIQIVLPPDNEAPLVTSYFFAFLMNWQLLPCFLYVYFALKIEEGFKELNQSLIDHRLSHNYLSTTPLKLHEYQLEILKKIRFLHNMLGESVFQVGKVFGLFIGLDKFCFLFVVVTNITVYILTDNHNYDLLILTVLNGLLMVGMVSVSESVKQNGCHIIDLLQGIPTDCFTKEELTEVMIILTQIIARPIKISANGYFEMDKYQIPAIFSSVATYTIVVLQIVQGQEYQGRNSTTNC